MFCVKCGNLLEEGEQFCSQCGNKVGEVDASGTVVKTKKDCIYDGLCKYIRGIPKFSGASFSAFELYEEGREGMIYVEIAGFIKNMFGKTVRSRFGAVIREVEMDGNCVFAPPGPQLLGGVVTTGAAKKILRFKQK